MKPLIVVVVIMATAVIAVSVLGLFYFVRVIKGDSMAPTIDNGEVLAFVKTSASSSFQRGDIVSLTTKKIVFDIDEQGLLKRVIGLPGDLVEISD
ncbi:MAG: signal peptidase I, partial [Anaerolineaceae bacterium]